MKKKIFYVILLITMLSPLFLLKDNNDDISKYEVSKSDYKKAYDLLSNSLEVKKDSYLNFLENVNIDYNLENHTTTLNTTTINYNESTNFIVDVKEAGYYYLMLDYRVTNKVLNNLTISLSINGDNQYDDMKTIDIPLRWQDDTKDFLLDRYQDELIPNQNRIEGITSIYLYNNTYKTDTPLLFYFNKGLNEISITNQSSGELVLENMNLIAPKPLPTYDEYKSLHNTNSGSEFIPIDAISYIEKNSSYIRMTSYKSPSVSPFDSIDRKLNIIDGLSWDKPGQEITYEFEVQKAGLYKIGLHYMNEKNDYSVFRTIRIDGELPFEELLSYEFKPTGKGNWANETLGNASSDFEFYLTEGKHSITLKAEVSSITKNIETMQLMIDHINQFALDIRKVTGKDIDSNRTWELTKYIPETESYLEAYAILTKGIIADLAKNSPNDVNSVALTYLKKTLLSLEKLYSKADVLPLYLDELYTGTGSVTQMLGDSMAEFTTQPLYLDSIYIYTDQELPKANASLIDNVKSEVISFFSSFTSDKYVVRDEEETLNIWINRPLSYVDVIQKLVDSDFTPKTGIKVKISVMPDANKLVLANASGQTPDVALGLSSYMPYELAIRGAVYDLTQFDDFWEYANNFVPGSFIPYILEDGVYAIPETLDFNAIAYRKDIFNNLGLTPPKTWDDVIKMLPTLQRFGMNFYHPIAGGTDGMKYFFQTSPFIYQYNGSLYNEDGLSVSIDAIESVEGLKFLTDLFKTYTLPERVPIFSNEFRYGSLPIGIVDFNNYMQLKNTAPELVGQWALSEYPSTVLDDGTESKWYIANGTSGMIFNDSKMVREGWEFLKWWLSTETQTSFGYTLQSTYGPEYVWLSSNVDALSNSPIDNEDKQIILNQIKWLRDIPRTPGQYMLERGLSDIWHASVFDNSTTRVEIDKQVITINREIKRKMQEFGYIDKDGNVIKNYPIREIDWVIDKMNEANGGK